MVEGRRFLIADPNHAARATLAEQLTSRIDCTATPVESAAALREQLRPGTHFDAIFMEARLPDADGRDLCRELRGRGFQAPILMLGASAREADVVWALDAGANDYLPKPYSAAVLVARVRAQLRSFETSEYAEVAIGNTLFRPGARTLVPAGGGRPLRLTDKEAGVLKQLHRAHGRPLSRETLLREVWGYSTESETHTVETHVYRLRKKVELPGCGFVIFNDAGSYRLQVEVTPGQLMRVGRLSEPVELAAQVG